MSKECSICGCTGIHACMGEKQEPWTEAQTEKFKAVMKQVKRLRDYE